MSEMIDLIKTRRSIRKFAEKEIEKNDLEAIAECAVYAPSAMNRQTWQFTVVSKKQDIKRLAEAVRKALGRDEYNMYDPAALIICSNSDENPFGRDDCACAIQNIFLAAHSLGIGSVWINQVRQVDLDPEVRKVLTSLQIPEDHRIFGTAALGYSAGEGAVRITEKKLENIKWN